ncbi:hypothetical protein [Duodenibacillus massiliensis]|uniref:hypothetical protein n=1 Tax=Duodenibacillus massiliensis TaxID=1852381 RepID=UPI003AF415F3
MKGKKIVSTLLALLLLASLPVSAHAATWDIGKGDITISAGSGGQTVTQGDGSAVEDSAPVITGSSTENTVTINAEKDQTASVTLSGANIDVSGKGKAAVSTNGEGNVSIELDGDNTLKSATNHAGLEKNNGGSLTIADENKNGKLTAKGGDYGAGIGGGWRGSGSDITISGGEVNATGGVNGAGIGGGCYGYGNNITVSGDAKLKVQGGVEDNIDGAGAGIGNGGSSDERAIPVTGAEVVPDTSGLTTNGSIEYYAPGADMEKDKPEKTTVGTLPPQEKPVEPIEPAEPEQPEAERGMDANLYRVTAKDGKDIAYTAEQKGSVLTVTVNEDLAILTGRLSGIRTLKAQGVEKIIFVTNGATSAFMLSDLLEKGESGDTYKLTHDGKAVTFTLGENMTDVSAILTKP